jgi:hypothetical protein
MFCLILGLILIQGVLEGVGGACHARGGIVWVVGERMDMSLSLRGRLGPASASSAVFPFSFSS